MKLLKTFLLVAILATGLYSCQKNNNGVDHDCPELSGIYDITSGSQHIIDSMDTDELTNLAGYNMAVTQSGCTLEFLTCMGPIEKGVVKCDTNNYGIDSWFGFYYENIQGKIEIDEDGTFTADIMIYATYPAIDYTGSNEVTLTATFNEDLTNKAQFGDDSGG